MRKTALEKLEAISAMDRAHWQQGVVIAGMDEAGRGPLAGPVMAACVVMRPEPLLLGINDSKKLTPQSRERLCGEILTQAIFANIGMADVAEIEALNIRQATLLAMARAAEGAPCDLFLIDGQDGPSLPLPWQGVVKGDTLSYSIAAASIVAKVLRDQCMCDLDKHYPAYGFAQHKGYGTAEHIAAIRRHGPCPEHRLSFLTRILEAQA